MNEEKMVIAGAIILTLVLLSGAVWFGYAWRDSGTTKERNAAAKVSADLLKSRSAEREAVDGLVEFQGKYKGLAGNYQQLEQRYNDLEGRVNAIQSGLGDTNKELDAVERGIDQSISLAKESRRVLGERGK